MNIALILSGGAGLRLGADIPKQYIEVGGKPIISYCIETLSVHPGIDGIQIVADIAWRESLLGWLSLADVNGKFCGFSNPGENRQLSILNGLRDIRKFAGEDACVLIHDAARPCMSGEMVSDCLAAVVGHDGVLPVLPMKDTVYLSENGAKVTSLLERSQVFAGQAPEVFRLEPYYEANMRLYPERILSINGSTEPAIMAGLDIAMIPGDEANFKITTKADLERFRGMVER